MKRKLLVGAAILSAGFGLGVGGATPASAECDLNITSSDSGPSCDVSTPALNIGPGSGKPCVFIGRATVGTSGATSDPGTGVYVDCDDRP